MYIRNFQQFDKLSRQDKLMYVISNILIIQLHYAWNLVFQTRYEDHNLDSMKQFRTLMTLLLIELSTDISKCAYDPKHMPLCAVGAYMRGNRVNTKSTTM